MSLHESEILQGGYPERVRDETQRYLRSLLAENEELRLTTIELETSKTRLEQELSTLRRELDDERASETALQQRLQELDDRSNRYLEQFMGVELHNTNLAHLYAASYLLHGTLERSAVVTVIQEIIVNLIGSEDFAVYEMAGPNDLRLVCAFGTAEELAALTKPGGHVWTTVAGGETFVAPPQAGLVACIPLKLDGRVTGVVAIRSLLPHKPVLEELDYELFELLATHAATALYCTALHERTVAQVQS